MKVSGFVSELNPLHYGHKYLIDKIREDNSDVIITAMSPNFTMRGEPTVFDKFFRTEKALENGVDLVLEIPTFYSIQAADIYAYKGVELLVKAGITDLYFGVEEENTDKLYQIVSIKNSDDYKTKLKEFLDSGNSFNQSSKKAIISIDSSLEETLNNPNNLLAVEYINAINKLNPNINIHMIKRVESNFYDSYNENKLIQSASSIRIFLKTNKIVNKLPYSIENIRKYYIEDYYDLIKYRIESSTKDELNKILNVTEGIENRIKSLKNINDVNELINALTSKRNRETKIKRILISILLNIKKDEIDSYNYIRALGFNKIGQKILKNIKDEIVITSIKKDLPIGIYREIDFTKIYDSRLENKEYHPIIY